MPSTAGISGVGLCKVSDPQESVRIYHYLSICSIVSISDCCYLFVAVQLPQFQLALGQFLFAVDNAAPCKVDQCFKSADLSNSDA